MIRSARLALVPFSMSDAREVFDAITPGVTRFMRWQAPASFGEYVSDRAKRVQEADGTAVSFVIRSADTGEFLGIAGIEDIGAEFPELGIWLKEAAQGRGYGGEAIRAVASWASRTFGKTGFTWPVAVANAASRRIAERMGGTVAGHASNPKYDSVIYRVPARRWSGHGAADPPFPSASSRHDRE